MKRRAILFPTWFTPMKTPHTPPSSRSPKGLGLLLWLTGMLGISALMPVIPSLLATLSNEALPVSLCVVQAAAFAQATVLLTVAVLLGRALTPQVGLSAPALEAAVTHRSIVDALKPQIIPGITGGVVGGLAISALSVIFLPHLPAAFVTATKQLSLPALPRLLYGGITEEILMRWGLMTVLVWIPYRLIQKRAGRVKTRYYVTAIVLSAIIFGLGHLPVVQLLSPALTAPLVTYVITANALFGVMAGYLYWRRGLESAILAHMVAHVILLSTEHLAGMLQG